MRDVHWLRFIFALAIIYFLGAYLLAPRLWKRHERKHPNLRDGPTLTHTASGIPGDPLNIAFVGSEEDVIRALAAAGWYPANPLTFWSSARIAVDTVFRRPDDFFLSSCRTGKEAMVVVWRCWEKTHVRIMQNLSD